MMPSWRNRYLESQGAMQDAREEGERLGWKNFLAEQGAEEFGDDVVEAFQMLPSGFELRDRDGKPLQTEEKDLTMGDLRDPLLEKKKEEGWGQWRYKQEIVSRFARDPEQVPEDRRERHRKVRESILSSLRRYWKKE